jgi:hypothetical protein
MIWQWRILKVHLVCGDVGLEFFLLPDLIILVDELHCVLIKLLLFLRLDYPKPFLFLCHFQQFTKVCVDNAIVIEFQH